MKNISAIDRAIVVVLLVAAGERPKKRGLKRIGQLVSARAR